MTRFWPCLFCLTIGLSISATAQDRMPKIPADKLTEAQKRAVEERNSASL
jgi:hypothetical protein